jgi:hypothetical protein
MSAPRSGTTPTSESLVWVTGSLRPSTKSHAGNGNRPCEAGRREVSGFNVSECIEPRNLTTSRKSRCLSFGSRQYSLGRPVREVIERPTMGTPACRINGRGRANPTGSKAVARYQMELLRTWESQNVPGNGYATGKPDGKRMQRTCWQSDYPIVPMKWGNARRWEGDSSNA